jgi:hypothetical protein
MKAQINEQFNNTKQWITITESNSFIIKSSKAYPPCLIL